MASKYIVFDNGGETLDRYTVIEKSTGDMVGMSETGAGFDQYVGNCVDNYMFTTFGYNWRKHCNVKKIIKEKIPEILNDFRNEGYFGKEISFQSLNKEVKQRIKNRFETF